jgi:hypothetical protein
MMGEMGLYEVKSVTDLDGPLLLAAARATVARPTGPTRTG